MHHPNWNPPGYPKSDQSAARLLNYTNKTNRIILNNGEVTRIGVLENQGDTGIDLAIVPVTLAHKSEIKVHNNTLGSDHLPILLNIEFQTITELPKYNPQWKISKADWDTYKALAETNFQYDSSNNNVQDMDTKLIDAINKSAELSIPKTKQVAKKPKTTVPWWNKECDLAIRNRENTRKTYRAHKSDITKQAYTEARKEVKKVILEAKRKNWQDFTSQLNHRTNSKEVWDKIHRIRGKSTKSNMATLVTNDQYITSNTEKANVLVKHYQKVSSDASLPTKFIPVKKAAEPKINKLIEDNCDPNPDPTYNKDFTLIELNQALSMCKNTAPGEDLINYEMIRQLPENGKVKLLELYNKSWHEGTSPEAWGKAVIIPILKPFKDKSDPASYRPISLTSALTKVMQRMIKARLVPYLEANNLIPNTQSGCRENRSCDDHLVKLEADIKRAQLDNKLLLGIFLDLSNAFDRCWNKGALYNLIQLGIKGNMLNWIANFLDNRQISVKVNGEFSDTVETDNGCPQGSVLSPIIFNIIMNSLYQSISKLNAQYEHEIDKVNLAQFVDDGAFWLKSGSTTKLTNKAQKLLNTIESWSDKWGFTINPQKTQVIIFHDKKSSIRETAPKLTLLGNSLEYSKVIKFLGILFDEQLTWKPHIDSLKDRCNKDLNLLRVLSGTNWGADKKSLMLLYQSLILGKINYGSIAFASASSTQLKKLQVIQNKALRLICGAVPGTPANRLQAELACKPLHLQFEENKLKYWARSSILGNKLPINDYLQETATFIDKQIKPHIRKPYCHTVRESIKELGMENVQVQNATFCTLSTIQHTCTPELSLKDQIDKKTSELKHMQTCAESFIYRKYPEHIKVYTDGSKDTKSANTGAGIAIFSTENDPIAQSKIKLDKNLSVFTAELVAIHIALKWIKTNEAHKCVILSDSLSALQAIENISLTSRPDLIHNIILQINKLRQEGYQIEFAWIPSHVGIEGNEKADTLAKQGSEHGIQLPLLPSKTEICAVIKSKMKSKFHSYLTTSLKPENPVIKHLPTKTVQYGNNRLEDIKYTRLRLGWGKMELLEKMQKPLHCRSCGIRLTTDHIFFDTQEQCPEFTNDRIALHNTLLKLNIANISTETLFFPPTEYAHTIRSAVLRFLQDTRYIQDI